MTEKGYNLFATRGTAQFLEMNGIPCTMLHWPDEDKKPNTLDYLKNKMIDLVINIPKDLSKTELSNDYHIRRSAVDFNIPLITNGTAGQCLSYRQSANCPLKILPLKAGMNINRKLAVFIGIIFIIIHQPDLLYSYSRGQTAAGIHPVRKIRFHWFPCPFCKFPPVSSA